MTADDSHVICPRCKGTGTLRTMTKLERARRERGWSRPHLAKLTKGKVTARAITAIESGQSAAPRWSTIRALLRAFDLVWDERALLFEPRKMSYWLREEDRLRENPGASSVIRRQPHTWARQPRGRV